MNNDAKELIGMLIVLTIIIAGVQWFLVKLKEQAISKNENQ